jgi:hypothetical protein
MLRLVGLALLAALPVVLFAGATWRRAKQGPPATPAHRRRPILPTFLVVGCRRLPVGTRAQTQSAWACRRSSPEQLIPAGCDARFPGQACVAHARVGGLTTDRLLAAFGGAGILPEGRQDFLPSGVVLR